MLYLDLETYSETSLKNGTFNYAKDAEVMMCQYAIDDGEVAIWDLTRGETMPDDLMEAIYLSDMPIVIHNSFFDRTVARYTELFPGADISPERIIDTMVQALSHGLPGKLDTLCTIFGLDESIAKMKEGRALIHFFCKPNANGRNTEATHPEKWAKFRAYGASDITSMRELYRMMPKWNYPGLNFPSKEHKMWVLDQTINDRGFAVDLELAHAAVQAASEEKQNLNDKTFEQTQGEVEAATKRDELLQYVLKYWGVTLPDMKADTLQRRVEDESLPIELRELLAVRIASSRNSSAKYTALIKNAADDDRLHGALQFCGAATTGRYSGRVFQPQNLMRPTMKPHVIEEAILDIKTGAAPLVYNNLAEVLGNCVRGCIVAPKGKKLIVADLSSIEGRGLAWLAGEEYILDFYRDVDSGAVNYDAYMLAYASVFGAEPEQVTKAQRTIGKPIELAFGYGGGVAAFLTFAITYHLDLEDLAAKVWANGDRAHLNECTSKYSWAKKQGYHAGLSEPMYAAFEYVKQKWRAARPVTVALWNDLAHGFKMAVAYDKKSFHAGPAVFRRDGQWMRLRLPSGRCLVFLQPKEDMSYMGLNRYSRKWGRVMTHGGKLAGLVTQAFASDILRDGLMDLETAGYNPVLSIHDEVLCETLDIDSFTVDSMVAMMTAPRPWAVGLPLTADGFETYRYRKAD